MKVVINGKHGGFGLSEEGMMRYAKIKGIALYPEMDMKYPSLKIFTYWTCPPYERPNVLTDQEFYAANDAERKASNALYNQHTIYCRDIARDDPALVQAVEELGEAASGRHAYLKVVEIPDDVEWEIDEYDGLEWVAEAHRTWE